MTDTPKTERYTYMGQRLSAKGPLRPAYRADDGAEFIRTKPILSGVPVGAVIEITLTDSGGYWTGGPDAPRVVGHASRDEIGVWEAEHNTARTLDARRTVSARLAKDTPAPLADALAVIRHYYREMGGPIGSRAAFVDYVTTSIQS